MLLLPPSLDEWLPEDHLARFISEIVEDLDISEILADYEKDLRGYPPYHPLMMLKILIYGYATGVRSSRKIAKKCVEDVAFRYLAANNFPKFRAIADFRLRHLESFKKLFLQVLLLCKEAGLANLGDVALDGTRIKANASKHKAMSYGRMKAEEERLAKEIEAMIAQAQSVDEREDELYGQDKAGDEMPEELRRKEDRLKRIRAAKAALEARAAQEKKNKDKGDDGPPKPDDRDQYNFTDPESRIMPNPADKKSFIQGYNAQVAVNENQVIVATRLTNEVSDCRQLPHMMAEIRANNDDLPDDLTADAGYFSYGNVLLLREILKVNALIPPDKERHGKRSGPVKGLPGKEAGLAEKMRRLLATEIGKSTYALRKALVEPVIGQIKTCQNFDRFLLRGQEKASGEWNLACLCHNLRKLFQFRMNEV